MRVAGQELRSDQPLRGVQQRPILATRVVEPLALEACMGPAERGGRHHAVVRVSLKATDPSRLTVKSPMVANKSAVWVRSVFITVHPSV